MKAPARMLDLLEGLRDMGLEVRAQWVGDGPLMERLANQTRERGLERVIDWVGEVSDPGVYLRTADLYFHPAEWENTSNAILEAMAMGVPVVARAVGGNAELLGQDRGLLYENLEEAVGRIASLLRDSHRIEEIRSRAQEYVRDRHSVRTMARAHAELLRGLVESK